MNTLEDLVRDALRARAEDFPAHPDAWEQLLAKRSAAGLKRRRAPRRSWPARFLIPAAAAAAVVVIVAAGVALKGVFGSADLSPAGAARATPSRPVGPYSPNGPRARCS